MKPGYSLWQLEKYLQGELSAAEQEQVSRAVANDPKLAAYLQRAKAWNEEALNLRLPPLPKALPQANPSANRGWSDLLDRLQNTWQAWTRPAWGKPGLALATLVLLVGLISLPWLRDPASNGEPNDAGSRLTPKGGLESDMRLEVRGQPFASGADIAVSAGDTLRLFYRSADSLHFQVWCRENDGSPHAVHLGSGEALPGSPKWAHAGKSLVLDAQGDCPRLQVIWAGSLSGLSELETRFRSGQNLPQGQSAEFRIRPAPAK